MNRKILFVAKNELKRESKKFWKFYFCLKTIFAFFSWNGEANWQHVEFFLSQDCANFSLLFKVHNLDCFKLLYYNCFRVRGQRTILEWHVLWISVLVQFFQLSDLNPGRLGLKRECYPCATPSPFHRSDKVGLSFLLFLSELALWGPWWWSSG